LNKVASNVVTFVKKEKKPCLLHINTYRLSPHSKGDDYRPISEINEYKDKDLINEFKKTLNEEQIIKILKETESYFEIINEIDANQNVEINFEDIHEKFQKFSKHSTGLIRKDINRALEVVFTQNKDILMWGEDIEAPYGGAFKITDTLSSKFEGRIINTPISESTIVGLGIGRALLGKVTIVEIMFSDFLTLSFDQILNSAAKFNDMFGKQLPLPLIIRCANGTNQGYGPTHSQEMSNYFLNISNVNLFMPNKYTNFEKFYNQLIEQVDKLSIVFENKNIYSQLTNSPSEKILNNYELNLYRQEIDIIYNFKPIRFVPDITLICSSFFIPQLENAIEIFLDEEIYIESFTSLNLKKYNIEQIVNSLRSTKKLILISSAHEGASFESWLWYELSKRIDFKGEIIFAKSGSIPANIELEKGFYPDVHKIVEKVKDLYAK
jgi:2-oxoisovalerate dehydrogenase E1 component